MKMSTAATAVITVTPTSAVSVPAHVSWLKRFGQILGKVASVFVKEASTAEPLVAKVAEALLPQFAPEIAIADGLVTKITKQVIVTEGIAAAASTATSSQDKLNAVIAGIGPELDAWIANMFPGAQKVATAEKAGLVNAVVAIVNKQPANVILASASSSVVAPAPSK